MSWFPRTVEFCKIGERVPYHGGIHTYINRPGLPCRCTPQCMDSLVVDDVRNVMMDNESNISTL